MKRIRLTAMVICMLGVSLSSCEKEEDIIVSNEQVTATKVKTTNSKTDGPAGPVRSTKLVDCKVSVDGGPLQNGTACFKSRSRKPCTGDHRCNTAGIDQLIATHLNALEAESWGDGTFFQENPAFVQSHYDFYLALFNVGVLAEHPDVIIDNIGGEQ